jgi:hypothetical protein
MNADDVGYGVDQSGERRTTLSAAPAAGLEPAVLLMASFAVVFGCSL